MASYSLTQGQWLSAAFLQQLSACGLNGFRLTADGSKPDAGVLSCKSPLSVEGMVADSSHVSWEEHSLCNTVLVVTANGLNVEKLFQCQRELSEVAAVDHWQLQASPDQPGDIAAVACFDATPKGVSKARLEQLCNAHQVELALLDHRPSLDEPGVLVMDMDSTLIDMECIDEIAKLAGVGREVSEVTEAAMCGKLDFAQSLTSRVACLAGAEEAILQQVRDQLPLMPGVERLCSVLNRWGWKLVIASGGFTYFADYLQQRLSLFAAYSNELEMESGRLTGHVVGDIVDANTKARVVKETAEALGIPLRQTVALGDGANDLVMMEQAGLGVAFHAKPIVKERAQASIRFGGTDVLLHYLTRSD